MLLFWFDNFQVGWNQVSVIQVSIIRVGVILLKLNYRIFITIYFQLLNIIAPSVFEKAAVSRVFTYRCTMPRRALVCKILHHAEGVKYVEATRPVTLW